MKLFLHPSEKDDSQPDNLGQNSQADNTPGHTNEHGHSQPDILGQDSLADYSPSHTNAPGRSQPDILGQDSPADKNHMNVLAHNHDKELGHGHQKKPSPDHPDKHGHNLSNKTSPSHTKIIDSDLKKKPTFPGPPTELSNGYQEETGHEALGKQSHEQQKSKGYDYLREPTPGHLEGSPEQSEELDHISQQKHSAGYPKDLSCSSLRKSSSGHSGKRSLSHTRKPNHASNVKSSQDFEVQSHGHLLKPSHSQQEENPSPRHPEDLAGNRQKNPVPGHPGEGILDTGQPGKPRLGKTGKPTPGPAEKPITEQMGKPPHGHPEKHSSGHLDGNGGGHLKKRGQTKNPTMDENQSKGTAGDLSRVQDSQALRSGQQEQSKGIAGDLSRVQNGQAFISSQLERSKATTGDLSRVQNSQTLLTHPADAGRYQRPSESFSGKKKDLHIVLVF